MKITILFVAVLAVNGCTYPARLVREDGLVKIYSIDPVLPHGSGRTDLQFKGVTYQDLRSGNYLIVSELNAILFTTGSNDGANKTTIHVVPIDGREGVSIAVPISSFGVHLRKDSVGLSYTCIEHVEGRKITFASKAGIDPVPIHYVLDIDKKTLSKSEH